MLDHKTIIWWLFSWVLYHPFFMVAMGVSDVSADVGVRLPGVKTLLTNIPVANAT